MACGLGARSALRDRWLDGSAWSGRVLNSMSAGAGRSGVGCAAVLLMDMRLGWDISGDCKPHGGT